MAEFTLVNSQAWSEVVFTYYLSRATIAGVKRPMNYQLHSEVNYWKLKSSKYSPAPSSIVTRRVMMQTSLILVNISTWPTSRSLYLPNIHTPREAGDYHLFPSRKLEEVVTRDKSTLTTSVSDKRIQTDVGSPFVRTNDKLSSTVSKLSRLFWLWPLFVFTLGGGRL